ncbi:hypothetical protein KGQ20_19185 [Catenulispora sp. NF23]|uniref:Uncharacterized protein n=1 Tax=Catenulispora pinistramenti TaxID=2705254 RepID=A0ABS5L1Q4_9ACTN|nr:hypothetical protein [Catenulispora pinistramenti]MBS2534897.1 hypothetical protein [Catenulispora pinistramenti]MBS2552184.1 hypothetical protein [Catenulispora pinistramenti]
MEERDELEIETRLRAALQARSELVTHSTLRPGIPPNEHTAGVRTGRESWWSWRRMWVPVTVAAALAGGVFVGAQLPSDSNKTEVGAGSGQPGVAGSEGSPSTKSDVAAGSPETVGTVSFTLADGWQLTPISATAGCVTPKTRPVPASAGSAGTLPCGVDALYLKTDAAPTAWPLSTASSGTGWWPTAVGSASDIVCPAGQSGTGSQSGSGNSGSGNKVKSSVLLRTSTDYALAAPTTTGSTTAAPTTAEYHEWAVTCSSGTGAQPMLWKLNAAPGATPPSQFAVATVVSVDPKYDTALLGMVGSLHQAS